MTQAERYTAEDLAEQVGLPVRTVRFYLSERLIDPPLGRGRGAHFDHRHLRQLQRVCWLRRAGLDLDSIRTADAETDALLAERGLTLAALPAPTTAWRPPPRTDPPDDETLDLRRAIRIPMAEGVELLVDPDRPLPSPRRLVEIAFAIRRAFERP